MFATSVVYEGILRIRCIFLLEKCFYDICTKLMLMLKIESDLGAVTLTLFYIRRIYNVGIPLASVSPTLLIPCFGQTTAEHFLPSDILTSTEVSFSIRTSFRI